ncbi:MAG: superoxide dismutase [Ni] [Planctomycetota bacterium]
MMVIRWILGAFFFCLLCSTVSAHCEIPCGIYDDEARFQSLLEDITTIEKSINQINELSKDPAANMNQIIRWVQNKEVHADKLSHTVTQYFMTQRVKPAAEGDENAQKQYVTKITLLHQMLLSTLKTKQTTDLAHIEKLRSLLKDFKVAYFGLGENKAYYSEPHPFQHTHPHTETLQATAIDLTVLEGCWELVSVNQQECTSSDQKAFWEFSANQVKLRIHDQTFSGSYSLMLDNPYSHMVLNWENSAKNKYGIFQLTADSLTLKLNQGQESFANHLESEEGFEILTFRKK